jgi:hypothetical protein
LKKNWRTSTYKQIDTFSEQDQHELLIIFPEIVDHPRPLNILPEKDGKEYTPEPKWSDVHLYKQILPEDGLTKSLVLSSSSIYLIWKLADFSTMTVEHTMNSFLAPIRGYWGSVTTRFKLGPTEDFDKYNFQAFQYIVKILRAGNRDPTDLWLSIYLHLASVPCPKMQTYWFQQKPTGITIQTVFSNLVFSNIVERLDPPQTVQYVNTILGHFS